jgi:hypothetical protein
MARSTFPDAYSGRLTGTDRALKLEIKSDGFTRRASPGKSERKRPRKQKQRRFSVTAKARNRPTQAFSAMNVELMN